MALLHFHIGSRNYAYWVFNGNRLVELHMAKEMAKKGHWLDEIGFFYWIGQALTDFHFVKRAD